MRSFLIRDILSGAAINATGGSAGGANDTAASHQELLAAAAAQSLATTQARLLAKWAEHQQNQQLQASKYFEQLQQQQHNHLNLNLITSTHAANLTNPTITSSPQLYQQQQQQYQQLLNSLSLNEHLKTQSHSHNHSVSISDTTTASTVTRHDEHEDEDHELDDSGDDDVDEQDEDEEIQVDTDEPLVGERKSTLPVSPSHQQEQASGSNQEKPKAADGRQLMEAAQCSQLNSPLDALFQMTSSTFDTLKRGEKRKERSSDSNSNFATKQNPKKKRKSRTAFTNSQIYELERRFRMQKYLSPTDRDEIAMTLNLSNAQVITWFQNRRAKMKRDVEEQRRDIETASLLNLHKTFLESFQALSQMKTTMNPKD